ncbi:MAG: hypothetical protein QGH40_10400, partial [bacterium]|nr:hypothetical protein [bacterium]
YTENYYVPSMKRYKSLNDNDRKRAIILSDWKKKVRHCWPDLVIEDVTSNSSQELKVGESLEVKVTLSHSSLDSNDVLVQMYVGQMDVHGNIVRGKAVDLKKQRGKNKEDDRSTFVGSAVCETSGRHGFSIRVLPNHPDLGCHFELHRVIWA